LYDIPPGNGVGLFLQPWSPHGVQINSSKALKQQLKYRLNQKGIEQDGVDSLRSSLNMIFSCVPVLLGFPEQLSHLPYSSRHYRN